MRQAQIFLYANGNDQPPTAIDLDKSMLKDLLFNQSPAKVCLSSFLLPDNRIKTCKWFSIFPNQFGSFLFLLLALGCCIGICFNEANSICPSSWEALTFQFEVRISETVLYRNIRRQRHTHHSPGEHDKRKPPWTGPSVERRWSLAFLLKASSPAQVISGNLKDFSYLDFFG